MIRLVVTDLDNTLYNWVDYFAPAFRAMLAELVRISGRDPETLKQSFKRVYEEHGTTEYAFAIEELDVLKSSNAGRLVTEVLGMYDPAIKAFRQTRRDTLHLYDGVVSGLQALRKRGKIIAAHTDAMMFYAEARIKQLGIEALFDGLVAPRDHGLIPGTRADQVRYYGDSTHYKAHIPLKRALDPDLTKPNPLCLQNIIRTFGARPKETVYVGDSLSKDIRMAQECGVHDVYASYGRTAARENKELLLEITHWKDSDSRREAEGEAVGIRPTFTIPRFGDLVDIVRRIDEEG